MDSSEYAINVFCSHVEIAGLNNKFNGKTLLELGPGGSIASAIIAASNGARAIIVDAGRFVCEEISPYLELSSVLENMNLPSTDLSSYRDIDEILKHCSARYMTEGLKSLR